MHDIPLHLGLAGACIVKLRVFPVVIKQLLYRAGAYEPSMDGPCF
jgi:hypothetical protein